MDKNGIFAFEYQENGKKLYVVFNVKDESNQFDNVDLSKANVLLSSDQMKLSKATELAPLSTLIVEVKDSENNSNNNQTDQSQSEVSQDNKQTDSTDNAVAPKADYLELELTHNAYVYQNDGLTINLLNGKKQLLPKGTVIKALNKGKKYSLNGKLFYQVVDNAFVKVANTVKQSRLKHNAFIYNRTGKALKSKIRHVTLKKGKKLTLLDNGKITTIKGKKYYRIGLNQYVKVANFY